MKQCDKAFLALPNEHWLSDYVQRLVQKEQPYITFSHRFIARHACYEPRLMAAQGAEKYEHETLTHYARTLSKPRITLPRFINRLQKDYLLLHECTHAAQDAMGLVMWPLVHSGRVSTMLSVRAHIRLTLFCELMAAIESTRIAHMLKEYGDHRAWQGAQRSKEWNALASLYEYKQATPSALNAMSGWFFESHLPAYYATRAQNAHNSFTNVHADTHTVYCDMAISDIIALLPSTLQEGYAALNWRALEECIAPPLPTTSALTPSATDWRDIIRGSALYWLTR